MKLWLDDVRPPYRHGRIGWRWVKTYEGAIELLQTCQVEEASLDHDLSEAATMGCAPPEEKTGYHVVCWMEENNVWPPNGVHVHSLNPVGAARMMAVISAKHFGSRIPATL